MENIIGSRHDVVDQVYELRFDLIRNATYHGARRLFFSKWNKLFNFVIVLIGTAIATQLSGELHVKNAAEIFGGLTTLVATFQLVFDFGTKASDHAYLQRRYFELLAELERKPHAEETVLFEIRSKMTTLYADEPPMMMALEAVAYNTTAKSLGKDDGLLKIGFWQTLLKNVVAFNNSEFPREQPPPLGKMGV